MLRHHTMTWDRCVCVCVHQLPISAVTGTVQHAFRCVAAVATLMHHRITLKSLTPPTTLFLLAALPIPLCFTAHLLSKRSRRVGRRFGWAARVLRLLPIHVHGVEVRVAYQGAPAGHVGIRDIVVRGSGPRELQVTVGHVALEAGGWEPVPPPGVSPHPGIGSSPTSSTSGGPGGVVGQAVPSVGAPGVGVTRGDGSDAACAGSVPGPAPCAGVSLDGLVISLSLPKEAVFPVPRFGMVVSAPGTLSLWTDLQACCVFLAGLPLPPPVPAPCSVAPSEASVSVDGEALGPAGQRHALRFSGAGAGAGVTGIGFGAKFEGVGVGAGSHAGSGAPPLPPLPASLALSLSLPRVELCARSGPIPVHNCVQGGQRQGLGPGLGAAAAVTNGPGTSLSLGFAHALTVEVDGLQHTVRCNAAVRDVVVTIGGGESTTASRSTIKVLTVQGVKVRQHVVPL